MSEVDGESAMADDQMDLLSGYGNVGVVWVGPDHTSVFRQFLLMVHMVWSLGVTFRFQRNLDMAGNGRLGGWEHVWLIAIDYQAATGTAGTECKGD